MRLEQVFVGLMVAAAVAPFVLRLGRLRAGAIAAVLGIAAAAATAMLPTPTVFNELDVANRPIQVSDDGYVGASSCRSCHPHNYDTWYGSYHRTMTQVASPETVKGDFDQTLNYKGRNYRLMRRDDEFWVEIDRPPGLDPSIVVDPVEAQVVMVTGSHVQQVYWYASGMTRALGMIPFNFLIDDRRWIPREAVFLAPPSTSPIPDMLGVWNLRCIKCHSTHGRPRTYDDRMDTHVGDFGISCEACHGPAEQHVELNRSPQRRYGYHLKEEPDPTIVNPVNLPAQRASEVCGQCHSISFLYTRDDVTEWINEGFPFRPGDELDESKLIARHTPGPDHAELQQIRSLSPEYKREDRFWSDGMVRISGREYNGTIEAPCYQGGEFSCFSCHQMHKPPDDPRSIEEWADDQLAAGMRGDQACLQCHDSFSTDVAAHTFHAAESAGSRCYNCHMPYTTYGLHKAIRSHQVDSPSVAVSVKTGRPNACNQCHLDRTLAWAADQLEQWYDIPRPDLSDDEQTVAASVLWTLRGDAGQRALMAWTLGWEPAREISNETWMVPYLAQLLEDPYPAVRLIAARSLRKLGMFQDLDYDFLDSDLQRAAAHRQALAIWNAGAGDEDRSTGDAILIDAQGALQQAVFDSLLRQRDDRSVVLRE